MKRTCNGFSFNIKGKKCCVIIDSVPKHLLQNFNTQCIRYRNGSEPIFIRDFMFCCSKGRHDSFCFGNVHQPNSVTTVLFTLYHCILNLKEPLYCGGCISVRIAVFCLPDVVLCCPLLSENHILTYEDFHTEVFRLHDSCVRACCIFNLKG